MKVFRTGLTALVAALSLTSTVASALDSTRQADSANQGQRQAAYPTGPIADMTPGDLCGHPSEYRYPEHIPYCSRNVDRELKRMIIAEYDRRFGFRIGQMNRGDFKIDHYIPLCAGGSNEMKNLWPQHKSVFGITDPLEALICEKMAQGKLKQTKAVEIIKQAKANLDQVEEIIRRTQAL